MKNILIGMLAVSGVALSLSSVALADDRYDVAAGKGEVTVTSKGNFHVNVEYPWSVTDAKGTKIRFTFEREASAKATGLSAGKAHVKGAVCKDDKTQCVPFEVDVVVN